MDLKRYQCIQDIGKIIELMQVFSLYFSSTLTVRYILFPFVYALLCVPPLFGCRAVKNVRQNYCRTNC